NTYTGATTISGGNVILTGANGALAGTSSIVLNQGGTLTLDNSTTNNANRINNAASLTLNGGTASLLGNATASTVEAVGTVTANSGASTVNIVSAGQPAGFSPTSLTRNPGATANFTGNVYAPSAATPVVPYATVNGADWLVLPGGVPSAYNGYTTSL